MEEFSDALRAQNVTSILPRFSPTNGFSYADTRASKPAIQNITFDRLKRDLESKVGIYRTLFEPSGLLQYMSGKYPGPWFGISPREFAPRDLEIKNVWVRWRLEGETWVVDTIALPAALARAGKK